MLGVLKQAQRHGAPPSQWCAVSVGARCYFCHAAYINGSTLPSLRLIIEQQTQPFLADKKGIRTPSFVRHAV